MQFSQSIVNNNPLDDLKGLLEKRGSLSHLLLEEGHLSNGHIFTCIPDGPGEEDLQSQTEKDWGISKVIPTGRLINLILDFLSYKPMNLCIFEGMRLNFRRSLQQARDRRIYNLKNEVCYFLSGEVSEELLLATIKDAEYDRRFVCLLSEGIRDTYDRQSRLIKDQQMRSLVRRAKYIILGADGRRPGFIWCYEESEIL